MKDPVLKLDLARGPARGVVLVLHGGQSTSHRPTSPRQLAVLRMQPFVRELRRQDSGLVIAQVRYRARGWNGAEQSPVPDTRWALDQLAGRFPDLPIALLGHSMGGRTALYAADHPAVTVVVGLAPWVEPGDPVAPVTGRRVLIVHGDHDRMTSPTNSAAYADAARSVATQVSYVSVTGGRHAMLGRSALWHTLAAGYAVGALGSRSDFPHAGTVEGPGANLVREALSGETSLVV